MALTRSKVKSDFWLTASYISDIISQNHLEIQFLRSSKMNLSPSGKLGKTLVFLVYTIASFFGAYAMFTHIPVLLIPAIVLVLFVSLGASYASKRKLGLLLGIVVSVGILWAMAFMILSTISVVAMYGLVNGMFYLVISLASTYLYVVNKLSEVKPDPNHISGIRVSKEMLEKPYSQILAYELGDTVEVVELGTGQMIEPAPEGVNSLRDRYLVFLKPDRKPIGWCAFYVNDEEELCVIMNDDVCAVALETFTDRMEKEIEELKKSEAK